MQGKKHRGKESINIVDVNADDFISTVDVHKSMTEEQPARMSHKKGDGPTSQQKRKHQITYLAHQVHNAYLSQHTCKCKHQTI
jgi:proline-rich protein PRCC